MILSPKTKDVPVTTTQGAQHVVDLTGEASLVDTGEDAQRILFRLSSIDDVLVDGPSIVIHVQSKASHRLRSLVVEQVSSGSTMATALFDYRMPLAPSGVVEAIALPSAEDASFILADELESLGFLEAKAEELRAEITAKKQIISQHLRNHRDNSSLRQLLEECDGLICAARVIAQRICDKVGMTADLATGYARAGDEFLQRALAFHDEKVPGSRTGSNSTVAEPHLVPSNGTSQGITKPIFLTENGTAKAVAFDLVDPPNPLVRALQIIATVLGLAALFGFLRRKCMSPRKRVDRLADREERRNARAYRKAARRAEMRKRWDRLIQAISCFRAEPEPRIEDYEEKRALILQDAFLEQMEDLENAEKGDLMEAEIRELRHAHEIVASLVRTSHQDHYGLAAPVHATPPPLVPLSYTPDTRSRASTHTLPSYTSETLPDYSSQPETLVDSSSVTAHSASDSDSLVTPPSSTSEGRHSGYTPTSSIIDTSPRPSEETLRTRQSKDTQDL
jgi:hypothetical protein